MNILFLTIIGIDDISERGIYTDLIREFRDHRHSVFIACPTERRFRQKTTLTNSHGVEILKIKTLNLQKSNLIEKGVGTLMLERQFLNAIKKHFNSITFDLVMYSTPPITLTKVIRFVKDRDNAQSYLLLKDIFPQNAVDLGMIKKNGLIYRYFKRKEELLYRISDFIGCMSPANVGYLMSHNDINPQKVEVNPNSLAPVKIKITHEQKVQVKKRYGIPQDSIVFIYGGNLGKPQGIDFLLAVIESNLSRRGVFFIIVGSGTEYPRIETWFRNIKPENCLLLNGLSKNVYDELLSSCDVGMVFLDKRFTIPNFPSRILSYLEYKIPILAATDAATDLGQIIVDNEFGYWTLSGDELAFNAAIQKLMADELRVNLGINGYNFMNANYLVNNSYKIVMKHF